MEGFIVNKNRYPLHIAQERKPVKCFSRFLAFVLTRFFSEIIELIGIKRIIE
jgi:hypothetical protein